MDRTAKTPATPSAPTTPTTPSALRQAVAGMIGADDPDTIPGDANLVYLGLGSLEMMRLATRWRREGLAVEFGVLAADPTIDAWERHLKEAAG